MGLGDIFEVTTHYTWGGQNCAMTRYFEQYEVVVPIGVNTAQVLADNFTSEILPAVRAAQHPALVYNRIDVRNLFVPADQHEKLVSLPGLLTVPSDTPLPRQNTAVILFEGADPSVRQGRTLMGGLSEAGNVAGQLSNPTYAATVLASVALRNTVTAGSFLPSPAFRPIIVKRVKITGEGDKVVYRLPENSAEAVFTPIITAIVKILISDLDSRKR